MIESLYLLVFSPIAKKTFCSILIFYSNEHSIINQAVCGVVSINHVFYKHNPTNSYSWGEKLVNVICIEIYIVFVDFLSINPD